MIGGYLASTEPAAITIFAATWAYQLDTTGEALIALMSMPARSLATDSYSASVGIAGFCALAERAVQSDSKNAPVKTRENECGSEERCAAGAELGNVVGSWYVKEFTAFRRQSASTASGCCARMAAPSCSARRES